jgi:hypothetical protein
VDGTAFLMTVSRQIKFITAEHIPVRMAKSLSKHIERVLMVYGRAGFKVRTILMDGEFEKIKNLMPTIDCNTTAAKEHVSKAEGMICTIKERRQGLITTLPFKHILRRMKIEFVYFTVLWLNPFPVKTGILATYSPWELLVQWQLDYAKHCWVMPRTYCEVHNEPIPLNRMMACTHEGIALGPTGNLQGSVKFYCLNTGCILKWHSFNKMPMSTRMIKCVDTIGAWEKQGGEFRFVNRNKEPFGWTDEVPEDNP